MRPGHPRREAATLLDYVNGLLVSELERHQLPVVRYQHDRLIFPGLRVPTHSRRVCRHPWQSQSHCIGPFREKSQHCSCGHVPLDHVPLEERGVARCGALGHSLGSFVFRQLRILRQIDAGTEILQVPDPP